MTSRNNLTMRNRESMHAESKSLSTADISSPAPRGAKRKAHLSEIFPGRYGQNSKHLLILDRAVYLFMQFANIKQSLNISMPALKAFLRKCNLSDLLNPAELEQQFVHISFYFTNKQLNSSASPGLPFHGFLLFLFGVARLKFSFCDDTLAALLRLLAYCDSSLRYYGVRSTRLRRTELEPDENANMVEIYLLPNRMRAFPRRPLGNANNNNLLKKSNNNNNNSNHTPRRQFPGGARQVRRARSLPRQFNKAFT